MTLLTLLTVLTLMRFLRLGHQPLAQLARPCAARRGRHAGIFSTGGDVGIIDVEAFDPADDDDGPPGQLAVALRFPFDRQLKDLVKAVLLEVRGTGYDVTVNGLERRWKAAGTWSPRSRCWWVRSPCWKEVRQRLLDEGVELRGALAHPLKRQTGGFFTREKEQEWDAGKCEWRWPPARKGRR